jgi:mono/diheme cytochrome c family protein
LRHADVAVSVSIDRRSRSAPKRCNSYLLAGQPGRHAGRALQGISYAPRVLSWHVAATDGNDHRRSVGDGEMEAEAPVYGRALYARECSSCHQANGEGVPGSIPPLARNPDLLLDRLFPVYVVLNGLQGPLIIRGASYDGVTPPFGILSDAQVVAIVTYVRSAWHNGDLRTTEEKHGWLSAAA